jgi:hypothetical protein
MDESENVIGFLGENGVLYCSRECSSRGGQTSGSEIDQDEYEALIESESIPAAELCCPACGAEFVVSWPDREPG